MARVELVLPVMHPGQDAVRGGAGRYNVLCCGRRWGKNILLSDLACDTILDKQPVGWWEPTYKSLADAWRDCKRILAPITARVSETEHRLESVTGGVLDMWTLDNPDSGRGRRYARAIINEAAMVRQLQEAWEYTIRPTLADYQGDAWISSTPKGRNYYWQLWSRGQDDARRQEGWRSWQFATSSNPHIAPEEIEAARIDLPDLAYRQEWLAEFLEDAAGVFRAVYAAVDEGRDQADEPETWQRYYMGVDLARTNDFTVISVFDSSGRQCYYERFNLISWQRQIDAIVDVYAKYRPSHSFIDSTGVGDAVVEMLQRGIFNLGIPQDEQRQRGGMYVEGYHLSAQSKFALIDAYAMAIERGLVRLMDLPVQTNELIGYEYESTKAGNVTMNAPPGGHDDTVIAGALANWGLKASGYAASRPEPTEPEFPVGRTRSAVVTRRRMAAPKAGRGTEEY